MHVWLWFCCATIILAEAPYTESEVKATCVFHLAEFVKWPTSAFESDSAPMIIGIMGSDPFNGALDKVIQGETVNSRKLVIRRSRQAEDMKGCQIVFIGQSEAGRLTDLVAGLQSANILTVSDLPQFCKQGGMIVILIERGKVVFEINAGAARHAGLRLSSQLLKIARKIVD